MLGFYRELANKETRFAETILEGGSYNLWSAFRRLPRLGSASEVRMVYNLLDSVVDRKSMLNYRTPEKYWTIWTRLCLKYRQVVSWLVGLFIFVGGKRLIKFG